MTSLRRTLILFVFYSAHYYFQILRLLNKNIVPYSPLFPHSPLVIRKA